MASGPSFGVNAKILLDYVEYKRLKRLANEAPTISAQKPQNLEHIDQSGSGQLCENLGVIPMALISGHDSAVIDTKSVTDQNFSPIVKKRIIKKKRKKNSESV